MESVLALMTLILLATVGQGASRALASQPDPNRITSKQGREFLVWDDAARFVAPSIVIQFDPAEETGTLAEISGNGFSFPYLYSVPMLWAKSPGQLLVPGAIAEADDLTLRK